MMRHRWLLYVAAVLAIGFIPFAGPLASVMSPKGPQAVAVMLYCGAPQQTAPKKVPEPPKSESKPKSEPKPKPQPKPKPKPAPKPEPVAEPAPLVEPLPEPVIEEKPVSEPETAVEAEAVEVPDETRFEPPAATEAPAPDAPAEPARATVDMEALKAAYYAKVRKQIAREKRYPRKALRFRQEGDVKVRFSVDAMGRLLAYEIIKKSPYRSLDKASEKLFAHIDTFERPPEELTFPLELTITINYTIKE